MLRRVRVRGYKSLRDVEVRFDRPLSVILGANASGKSNLFDALALLSRMVTKPTLQEAFKEHRGTHFEAFSFGSEGVEGLFKQASAEFSIEVDVELSSRTVEIVKQLFSRLTDRNDETASREKVDKAEGILPEKEQEVDRFIRYSVAVQLDIESGHLYVTREQLAPLNADFTQKRDQNTFVERSGEFVYIRMGYEASSGYTSPSSSLFLQPIALSFSPIITKHVEISQSLITAAYQEISHWRFYDPDPKAMHGPIGLRNVTNLSTTGDDLAAFFNTMKVDRPKHFESIRRALRLLIPEIEAFDVKRDPEGYLHLIVREHGTEYSSRVISDGTLRMLGLLALTNPLEPATLLGIEEPENGVDPHRLRYIADLLKTTTGQRGMQVLVNTHSPLLPRYFSEDDLIYCWRADGETIFESAKTSGLWRDPIAVEKRLSQDDEAESEAPVTTTS